MKGASFISLTVFILVFAATAHAYDPVPADCSGACSDLAGCAKCINSCEDYIKKYDSVANVLDQILKGQTPANPSIDPTVIKNLESCWCTGCCEDKMKDTAHPCIYPCPCSFPGPNPTTTTMPGNKTSGESLQESIGRIIRTMDTGLCLGLNILWLVIGSVASVILIYSGFRFLTSEDNSVREVAKRRVFYCITGLVIALIGCPAVDYLIAGSNIIPLSQSCKCYQLMDYSGGSEPTLPPIVTLTTRTKPSSTTVTTIPVKEGCVVFDSSVLRFRKTSVLTAAAFGPGACDNSKYAADIADWLENKPGKSILVYTSEPAGSNAFTDLLTVLTGAGYKTDYKVRNDAMGKVGVEITSTLLDAYSQVWFMDPEDDLVNSLSTSELAAIMNYHQEGGGILVSRFYNSYDPAKKYLAPDIANQFGVNMDSSSQTFSTSSGWCIPYAFTPSPPDAGVTNLSTSGTEAVFSSASPAVKAIATYNGKASIMVIDKCKVIVTTTSVTTTTSGSTTTSTAPDCLGICHAYQASGTLPSSFNWHNVSGVNYLTPVRAQGLCGSCWAFSTIGSMEGVYNVEQCKPSNTDLSEQELVSCDYYPPNGNNGCSGGFFSLAHDYIKTNGECTEICFPYKSSTGVTGTCSICASPALWTTTSIITASATASDIKAKLICNGPLSVAGWSTYYAQYGKWYATHAITLAGWDDDSTICKDHYSTPGCWIIKNSWGVINGMISVTANGKTWTYYHEKGYAYIPYNSDGGNDITNQDGPPVASIGIKSP